MKHVKKTMAATVVIAGIIGAASLTFADNDKTDYLQLLDTTIELNDAVDIANTAVPGKIFEAELELEDNQAVWEIEIMSAENQRFEIEIDASTGEVLSQELEDD